MNIRSLVVLLAAVMSGCAAYTRTPRLAAYDLTKGYRFEQLPLSAAAAPRNSDELFVVLAFSGGGTRAAALSYGVLAQLREVRFHWNPQTGEAEACEPADSPRCRALERSLLDEVDVISSVSGGSFTAAYYALRGDAIFDPAEPFHRAFLYYPVQRDLLGHAVYYPKTAAADGLGRSLLCRSEGPFRTERRAASTCQTARRRSTRGSGASA